MKRIVFFKYFAYSILIILLYVLQATPSLMPEIFGSKPLLLVPFALSLASVENKIQSLVFGAVCGVLTDIASSGGIGYFAIALTLLCYFEAHIFEAYFVPGVLSALVYSAASVTVLIMIYFLLFKVFAGIGNLGVLFVNHYISRIVYTALMFIPICFLTRFIHNSFRKQQRIV